jgi:putative acetyltransferase
LVLRIRTSAEAVLLSLVAEKATRVIGHAMFSYLGLEGSDAIFRRVALLAPLALQPEMQGYGVGSALVRQGIERLEARGEPVVIVRGDLRYYGRFGFRPAVDLDINAPSLSPRDHYLARPLRAYEPSYRGVVRYPPPFGAVGYPIEWTGE